MNSKSKLKRRTAPLQASLTSSCTKVPRPFRSLAKEKVTSAPQKKVSGSCLTKTSPTDSGICTETKGLLLRPPKAIPPDGYYHQNDDKKRGSKNKKCSDESSSSISLPPSVKVPTKSDSGQGDLDLEEDDHIDLDSLELDSEPELQFSQNNSNSSLFDAISSQSKSSSRNNDNGKVSEDTSFSTSYTCSNSCCLSEEEDTSSEDEDLGSHSFATNSSSILLKTTSPPKKVKSPEVLKKVSQLKTTLKTWDKFLSQNGISRPDFFCRYKERQDLERFLHAYQGGGNKKCVTVREVKRRGLNNNGGGRKRSFSVGENWRLRQKEGFMEYESIQDEEQVSSKGLTLDPNEDASSPSTSAEAVHLQAKLKSLSSELVTLRNRLHVNNNHSSKNDDPPHPPGDLPQVPPHQGGNGRGGPTTNYMNQGGGIVILPYPNKPLPPQPSTTNSTTSSSATTLLACNNNNNNSPNGVNVNNGGGGGPYGQSQQQQQCYYENQHFQKEVLRIGGDILGVANNNPDLLHLPRHHQHQSQPSTISGSSSYNSGAASLVINGGSQTSESTSSGASSSLSLADVEDLVHLQGPLTEDALLRVLSARLAAGKPFFQVGPILHLLNNNNNGTPDVAPIPPPLTKVVGEALRAQAETGFPQAIILSGVCGAGKTTASSLILRQLFSLAGSSTSSDAYKHLAASLTVLRSLGSAATALNPHSSRVGHFIEAQVSEGTIVRSKVHVYFLDQSRIVKTPRGERNYGIFYQMLAGLSPEERKRFHLGGHSVGSLRYLSRGEVRGSHEEDEEEATRFQEWKQCLGMLGIPFLDVVRVLAAIILLGNVEFNETTNTPSSSCMEMEVKGEVELQSAASLLGVSEHALKQGLSTRTHGGGGSSSIRSRTSPSSCNFARDSLAKSLYTRTVATIVRRANSIKRLQSSSGGTLSSDSEAVTDVASHAASTVGTAGSKASRSMTALESAVRLSSDGFVGVLDMFGFEDPTPSGLETLCINLTSETMQHFYNTHVFKAAAESAKDEGVASDWEVEYVDNVPVIDLVSSLRTGLLSMLDAESKVGGGSLEGYLAKVRAQHGKNPRLLPSTMEDNRCFEIQHFAGRVVYNAMDFLDTNRDILPDDLVAVFHKHRCSFGFASHLFSAELKVLGAGGMEPAPRGLSFRISPTVKDPNAFSSSLTGDFHTRLDSLLRTLVHAKPHFIRCIKTSDPFNRTLVTQQLRAFQVLETVNLMVNGFPSRMRFKAFVSRYKALSSSHLSLLEENAPEDAQAIVQEALDKKGSSSWALGKRHIFLSEGTRQTLETLRTGVRIQAATLIQALWRGHRARQKITHFPRYHTPQQQQQQPFSPYMSQQQLLPRHPVPPPPPVMMGPPPPQITAYLQHQTKSQHPQHPPPLPFRPPHFPNAPTTTISHQPFIPAQQHHALSLGGHPPHHETFTMMPSSSRSLHNGGGPFSNGGGSSTRSNSNNYRPSRPQPISGTPPPPPASESAASGAERCDPKLVQETCHLFGLDMERPPPLPPSRSYTVSGNTKLGYPQSRVMKMTFPDEGHPAPDNNVVRLLKGESVTVVGTSSTQPGHLLVEVVVRHQKSSSTLAVPFQYLELELKKSNPSSSSTSTTGGSRSGCSSSSPD